MILRARGFIEGRSRLARHKNTARNIYDKTASLSEQLELWQTSNLTSEMHVCNIMHSKIENKSNQTMVSFVHGAWARAHMGLENSNV